MKKLFTASAITGFIATTVERDLVLMWSLLLISAILGVAALLVAERGEKK